MSRRTHVQSGSITVRTLPHCCYPHRLESTSHHSSRSPDRLYPRVGVASCCGGRRHELDATGGGTRASLSGDDGHPDAPTDHDRPVGRSGAKSLLAVDIGATAASSTGWPPSSRPAEPGKAAGLVSSQSSAAGEPSRSGSSSSPSVSSRPSLADWGGDGDARAQSGRADGGPWSRRGNFLIRARDDKHPARGPWTQGCRWGACLPPLDPAGSRAAAVRLPRPPKAPRSSRSRSRPRRRC